MSKAKYSEIRKKQPGGRYVWGVPRWRGGSRSFRLWAKAKRLVATENDWWTVLLD
jgi:hypothetical protein